MLRACSVHRFVIFLRVGVDLALHARSNCLCEIEISMNCSLQLQPAIAEGHDGCMAPKPRKLKIAPALPPAQELELTPVSAAELRSVKHALALVDEGEWGEDFHAAPEIIFEYSRWLATIPQMREPEDRRAFAKKWGLPTGMLNDIEEHPEFVRMHAERYRLAGFNRQTHNMVMENLARMASSPFAKAGDVELYLQQTGTLKPKVAVALTGDDLKDLSDEELERELEKIESSRRRSFELNELMTARNPTEEVGIPDDLQPAIGKPDLDDPLDG